MQKPKTARSSAAEFRFTPHPAPLGEAAQTFMASSPDTGNRHLSANGRNDRLPVAKAVSQKENALGHVPLCGINNPQLQRDGQLERPSKLDILRGTNKPQQRNYSCPEECGLTSGWRADEVRLLPWRQACPDCVAGRAVWVQERSR